MLQKNETSLGIMQTFFSLEKTLIVNRNLLLKLKEV